MACFDGRAYTHRCDRIYGGMLLLVSGTEAMQSESIGTYRGAVIYLDWQSEGEPPFMRHFCTYRCTANGEELANESLSAA